MAIRRRGAIRRREVIKGEVSLRRPARRQGRPRRSTSDYNIAALLCYLPVCCINIIFPIIWLTTEPRDNRFLRFHALQSLYLLGLCVVVWIAYMLLSFIGAMDPTGFVALVLGIAGLLLYVVFGIGVLILVII